MYNDIKCQAKKWLDIRLIIAGLVIIAFAITGIMTNYVWTLQNLFQEESNTYLNEISRHISDTVNYRAKMNLSSLETISSSLVNFSGDSASDISEYLNQECIRYGFLTIDIADRDGTVIAMNGNSIDLAGYDFFQNALSGQEGISDVLSDPRDGRKYILFAAPVFADGAVSGVLVATHSLDTLKDLLNVESFNGEGFSQIIRRTGEYVVTSPNKNAPPPADNYFAMLRDQAVMKSPATADKFESMVQNGVSGILEATLAGVDKRLSFHPLEVKDWYLLTVVPSSVITAKTNIFIQNTSALCGVIILLFIALITLLVTQQAKSQKRLCKIAFEDPITGGYSKNRFELETMKLLSGASSREYALVSMDVERFKLINESFGRESGNRTLNYILRVIQSQLQPGELAARSSSDNFLFLVRFSSSDELIQRLESLLTQVNQFNDQLQKKYFMGLTFGVFVIDDTSLDFDTIQDRANVARQSTKQSSERIGNCIFYSDVARLRMIKEKEIENKMDDALKNGEFVVYLQPKVELESNTVAGAEALVRWKDPEKGLIPPMDFIPLFERNGFIVELDLYVFEQVCKKIRGWLDQGVTPVPVSVNLSRVHLNNPDFLSMFEAIFFRYEIPANLIEIELTETVVFENMELLIQVIDRIHKLGFTCSLDDFGSGYSSLNILKDVPVDVIKLDRAFFHSSGYGTSIPNQNKRGDSVVESVIELAKKLEIHTVSEGVETIPQVDFLRKVHCDMIQGYVFSKPVPMEEFDGIAFGTK